METSLLEIAAIDQQVIRSLDDPVEILERFLTLDLCDDLHPAADAFSEGVDVGWGTNEGERDVLDPLSQSDVECLQVLRGKRGQFDAPPDHGIHDDGLVAAHRAACQGTRADDAFHCPGGIRHSQDQRVEVDVEQVSFDELRDDFARTNGNRLAVPRYRLRPELDLGVFREVDSSSFDHSRPDLSAFRVDHERNADGFRQDDGALEIVERGVRHVRPHEIHASSTEAAKAGLGRDAGTERDDDARVPRPQRVRIRASAAPSRSV